MQQPVLLATWAQRQLWFLHQLLPDSPVHNVSVALRLLGPLHITALEESLNEIITRHDVLRATFSVEDGQLVQHICPALPRGHLQEKRFTLPVVSLYEVPESARETAARQLVTIQAQQTFDLANGPLLRATLLRLETADQILLLTMPRIATDDGSIPILLQELAVLYAACRAGQPSPLLEPARQYVEFAERQQQWLQTAACAQQLSYWQQQLGDQPPLLQLPTDRPHTALYTYRGSTHSLLLPASLSTALNALSGEQRMPLSTVLLAAFQTLLYRYSGQKDISVGVPIDGRHQRATERLIGCCANTMVLRLNLTGDPTFSELLERVQTVIAGAHAHQDLPFAKLVEQLQPEPDFSRTPLFQAMFRYRSTPQPPVVFPDLQVQPLAFDQGAAPCDVTLEVVEHAAGLCCAFTYNTDLFEAATMARLAGHFQTLLEGIVANPQQAISRLPLLSAAERAQLLEVWNTIPAASSEGALVHERLAAQVERTPDAIAVVCDQETLTYRELANRTTQVARYLHTFGVGPESLVGLCMERSVELVVGLFGILKAGGACVPLDPAYPQDRLTFMLEDTQVPVILTQRHLLQHLPPHTATVICLDTDWQSIAQESTAPLASGVTSGNLTFVFYTSGSTGQPKAVMWPHHRTVLTHPKVQATAQLTTADRHLLKCPIGFTLLSREVFWPLLSGAQLYIVPPGQEQDSAHLVKFIAEQQITVINLVPSMLHMLLEEPGLDACTSLRQVVCFGEPLSAELQERLLARLHVDLSVYYGVTEAPSVTSWTRRRGDTQRLINIGQRLPDRQIYILDAHVQPVPIGVPGQMYIGGRMSRGYFHHPDLTAEKFVPHPFSDVPGARLYKTGDLARYVPDGSIEFLGREDDQVKIRGVRIELGEIETVLRRHPAVQEVVVLAQADNTGTPRLVVYIVPGREATPTVSDLQHFLKQRLPTYMAPSMFVFLPALPLSPNGKIDRRALPRLDLTRPALDTVFIAPRTPVEETMANMWKELLRLDQVGVHDNFFEIGGHSVLATQILVRIHSTFGAEIPLRSFFETPTVAGLAIHLTQHHMAQLGQDEMLQALSELEGLSEEATLSRLANTLPYDEQGERTHLRTGMRI